MSDASPMYRFHGHRAPQAKHRDPIRAEVPAAAADGGVATIRLYDPIDSYGDIWGVSAKEFTAALDELSPAVHTIELHLNSPGGEVHEGIAIANALRNHPARVNVTVDGLAASAASFIAAAGDELTMGRNSQLMIHDAWGLVVGNSKDMLDMARVLDKISDNIASMYADKAGGDPAVWRDAMRAETWYSAEEAVEAGLADKVAAKKSAEPSASFDLSVFAYQGRENAPEPVMPATVTDRPTLTPEAAKAADRAVGAIAGQAAILAENVDDPAALTVTQRDRIAEAHAALAAILETSEPSGSKDAPPGASAKDASRPETPDDAVAPEATADPAQSGTAQATARLQLAIAI